MIPLQTNVLEIVILVFIIFIAVFTYVWFRIGSGTDETAGQSSSEGYGSSEDEQKFCSECGVAVGLADAFCYRCGHPLIEEKEGKRLCLECEHEAEIDDQYCSNCGHEFAI